MQKETPKIAVILVAAGTGSRFGGAKPKQYLPLAGKPVLSHAAKELAEYTHLLQPVGDITMLEEALNGIPHLSPVPGGEHRQDSVRAGLEALTPFSPDFVLIHDAARPFIPRGLIPAIIDALAQHAGAIPAVSVSDTLKRGKNGICTGTVPRDNLYRAQTPQGFHYQLLLDLHRAAEGGATTDDSSLLENAGHRVALVAGSEQNVKITYPEDLVRMERHLSDTRLPHVGTGFDVHVLAKGRPLILCGVEIPFECGLAGHSDADVGIHALCDAIYGAMAEGDIGRHFPPSEMTWKDADSARFLRHAAELVCTKGGQIVNADVTLICERPKIGSYALAMRTRLGELMTIPPSRVSVKATTTEQLGFTGRGEGIAAQAVATVLLPLRP